MRYFCIIALSLGLSGCKGEPPKPKAQPSSPQADQAAAEPAKAASKQGSDEACASLPPLPAHLPAPERIVAIGDLHGDINAMRDILRLVGAVDDADQWAGGKLVLVQTGDILDRGDDEQAMMDWFERLRTQAAAAGGAVHVLNGNHELMNAEGDLRYVTPGGFRDFADADLGDDADAPALADIEQDKRPRVAAFRPGGVYARILSQQNVAVVVGDTAFVHGGISPKYAKYGLDKLNREVRCWLTGAGQPPAMLNDQASPVWSRAYSLVPEACDQLGEALAALGAKRMVVGHTVQLTGVTSACDDRIWRIDVGLAAHYGGPKQALEIRGAQVRVLK